MTESQNSTAAQPASSPPVAEGGVKKKQRNKKERVCFMLHDASTFSSLGKFVSTDYRYAALKVASRGHKDILLRKTNTKQVYQFAGDVITLEEPQKIKRGDREIVYTKKPTVRLIKKFIYTGPLGEDETVEGETPKAEEKTQA